MAQTKDGAIRAAASRVWITVDEYNKRVEAGGKWCTGCKSWIPSSQFGKDISRYDGLSARCFSCRRGKRKTDGPGRAERTAMQEKGLAWCRGCKAWASTELIRRGVCREHANQEDRERYASDRRYREKRRQKTYARKRNIDPVSLYIISLFTDYNSDSPECVYCGNIADTWDHVKPVSKGGNSDVRNVLPACSSCNSSKNNRHVLEWIEGKGLNVSTESLETIVWYCYEQGILE